MRVIRHGAGWVSNDYSTDVLARRIDQLRDGAGHDVPLAMFGTPIDPEYWRAVEDLGFGRLALMLPTLPVDDTLRTLDGFASVVEQYRT